MKVTIVNNLKLLFEPEIGHCYLKFGPKPHKPCSWNLLYIFFEIFDNDRTP